MAIQYVGGQVGGFAGKTGTTTVNFALTNGLASVPAANDLVVISYSVGSTVDRALTIQNASAVNYTLAGSELYQNDTFDSNLRVVYRFMPATPETSFVLSGTGSTADAGTYTVKVYRGVDPTTPLDVAVVTAGNINTRLANPGAITPVTAGAWIHVTGAAAGGTGGTFTNSQLSDFRATSQVDTNDALIGSGHYTAWTSGAFDPVAFAGGGTDTANDSWTAVTIALRPEFTERRAQVGWSELEAPNGPRLASIGWVELEVPNAPRRSLMGWAEFEVPNAPRRAILVWAEAEFPNGPRRAVLGWAEAEVPDAPVTGRRAVIGQAHLEAPWRYYAPAPRLSTMFSNRISKAHFKCPAMMGLRRARVGWAEFETPGESLLVNEVANESALLNHPDVMFYPNFGLLDTNVGGQWWFDQAQYPTSYPNGVGFNTTVENAGTPLSALNAYKIGSLYKPDHYLKLGNPPTFVTSATGEYGARWQDYQKYIKKDGVPGEPLAATALGTTYRNDLYLRFCFKFDQSVVDNWNNTDANAIGFKMSGIKSGPLHDTDTGQILAQTLWAGKPGTRGAPAGKIRAHMYWGGLDVTNPIPDVQDLGVNLDPGVWYCHEQRFKLNDKGQSNGARDIWHNDTLVYSSSGVQMHNYTGSVWSVFLHYVHQQLYYGGPDLTIQNGQMFVSYTGFCLATRRIGMPVAMR